jgi:PAS domain S-box-containing protein
MERHEGTEGGPAAAGVSGGNVACPEEALPPECDYLAAVLDTVAALVVVLDPEGRIVGFNRACERTTGYRVPEVRGRCFWDIFLIPDEADAAKDVFARLRAGDFPIEHEGCWLTRDGECRRIAWSDTALVDGHGAVTHIMGTGIDVTTAERDRREVERLNAELERANGAKDQFLAVLSHELRNPLSAVLAGVDMLGRLLPKGDPRVERTLGIVDRNVQLQTRLVNDLLDLSRMARGKLTLHHAPVSLETVIRDAVDSKQDEAEESGLLLHADVEANLWVYGDADRLGQVILNLLANAMEFTPEGGHVLVWATALPSGDQERGAGTDRPPLRVARVVVEDTGLGIPDELLPHVFEMFRQGDAAADRKPGLSLGLALVRSLVEKHEGRVWAESDGPGKGSRFILELPLMSAGSRE